MLILGFFNIFYVKFFFPQNFYLEIIELVANSSPQTVFRKCICFDFAKFSANVFSHAVFRFVTGSTCSVHVLAAKRFLLPWQPLCYNFAFLVVFCSLYRLSVVPSKWLLADRPTKGHCPSLCSYFRHTC